MKHGLPGLILVLALVFSASETFASTLILKLKPDYRGVLESRTSNLSGQLQSWGLPMPTRRFPFHKPLRQKERILNRPLTDLSLLYQLEVPEPFRTSFLLAQLQKRPEIEYAEWEEQDAQPLGQPNDPQADSLTGGQRQVFRKIQAYQAWSLSKGDSNVVIGVLDTGIPVDHEDVQSQIKVNPLDPPNGVDDDQNGLIDDYRGWDFGGNDNNPNPDNNAFPASHGTSVAAVAGAATNNGIGIASLAWNCKILPVKIWRYTGSTASNFKGYDAIVYAADRGCKIINCSWGGARDNRQFEQDIVNYATFNKNALVVAAGGNTPGYYNVLPANYDYVLGVATTDTTDVISSSTSQNLKLDLTAPGLNLFAIRSDGTFGYLPGNLGGSSIASPLVAAAAALVRSRFPELSAVQAGELIRVNTDTIYSLPGNDGFRYRAGSGRLNVYKALQKAHSISIRATDIQLRTRQGIAAKAGDTVAVFVRFENYLDSLNGFSAKAYSGNNNLTFLTDFRTSGPIGSMKSLVGEQPFLAIVNPALTGPANAQIRIDVSSGAYKDINWFSVALNESILDLDANDVRITGCSNGRLGYKDNNGTIGSGIVYKGVQYCGDAGLMIGTNAGQVSNSVYNTTDADKHFATENPIRFSAYPDLDQHALVHLNDSAAGAARIGIGVKQSMYAQSVDSLSGTVWINYQITNRNTTPLDSISVAMYNDWEVENLNLNLCRWVDSLRLGYTSGQAFRNRFAATQLLSPGEPQFYAIDALPNTTNGNINLFDGFSMTEKWRTMSNGIGRAQAGNGPGNNVVQVTGVKLRSMAPGETRKVTFAFLFADSLPQLIQRAKSNRSFFRSLNISPSPAPQTVSFCEGDSVQASVSFSSGLKTFRVWTDTLSTSPVYEGQNFSVLVSTDSVLYLQGVDSLVAGPLSRWEWQKQPLPSAFFLAGGAVVGDTIALDSSALFIAQDTGFQIRNQWFVNDQVQADTSARLLVLFDSLRVYSVCLEQTDRRSGCSRKLCSTIRVFQPLSAQKRQVRNPVVLYPNPSEGRVLYNSAHSFGLEVYDGLGRKIHSSKQAAGTATLDFTTLPKGLYRCRIQTLGNGFTEKLMIR